MRKSKAILIAKPPFTKPPFVNSRINSGELRQAGVAAEAAQRARRGPSKCTLGSHDWSFMNIINILLAVINLRIIVQSYGSYIH